MLFTEVIQDQIFSEIPLEDAIKVLSLNTEVSDAFTDYVYRTVSPNERNRSVLRNDIVILMCASKITSVFNSIYSNLNMYKHILVYGVREDCSDLLASYLKRASTSFDTLLHKPWSKEFMTECERQSCVLIGATNVLDLDDDESLKNLYNYVFEDFLTYKDMTIIQINEIEHADLDTMVDGVLYITTIADNSIKKVIDGTIPNMY